VSLSTRAEEVGVGNVKERIAAGSRLAVAVEGLRSQALVREEGLVVVLKGTRRSPESEV
jgi:hypothetical protein